MILCQIFFPASVTYYHSHSVKDHHMLVCTSPDSPKMLTMAYFLHWYSPQLVMVWFHFIELYPPTEFHDTCYKLTFSLFL
jgi:hypothetical protein